MAIKNKTDIKAEINSTIVGGGGVTATDLNTILNDIVDSYEDLIQEYTTVQRDLLSTFEGLKIYNTTSNRLEYYSSAGWLPCSQKEVVAVDCSGNPNYSEALVGDQYIVSVAGLIGGASGKTVYVGDLVYCIEDNAGGDEATVGTKWQVCHSAQEVATMKKAIVTITAAQMNNSYSVPVLLIAAVSGRAIQIVCGNAKAIYVSSPFSVTGNSVMIGVDTISRQFDLDVTFTNDIYKPIRPYTPPLDVSISDNMPIYLAGATAVSGGDSDIIITLYYLEV